jgi:hypothetical protein
MTLRRVNHHKKDLKMGEVKQEIQVEAQGPTSLEIEKESSLRLYLR